MQTTPDRKMYNSLRASSVPVSSTLLVHSLDSRPYQLVQRPHGTQLYVEDFSPWCIGPPPAFTNCSCLVYNTARSNESRSAMSQSWLSWIGTGAYSASNRVPKAWDVLPVEAGQMCYQKRSHMSERKYLLASCIIIEPCCSGLQPLCRKKIHLRRS